MNNNLQFFFHFFNSEILRTYNINLNRKDLLLKAYLKITRFALLLSDLPILAPVSSIFENPFFVTYINEIKSLIEIDAFRYISPSADINEYGEKKVREFRNQPNQYPIYSLSDFNQFVDQLEGVIWQPRIYFSASKEISKRWLDGLEHKQLWWKIIRDSKLSNRNISKIESNIASIPQKLDEKAFVFFNVENLIPLDLSIQQKTEINFLINRAWIESYLNEYKASIIVESPVGMLDFDIHNDNDEYTKHVSYKRVVEILQITGLYTLIELNVPFSEIIEFKSNDSSKFFSIIEHTYINDSNSDLVSILKNQTFQKKKENLIKKIKRRTVLMRELALIASEELYNHNTLPGNNETLSVFSNSIPSKKMSTTSNRIFLIHGRDTKEINTLKSFLKSISLEVIEWEDAVKLTGNPASFVFDIIKAGFSNAQATVVLFTPDEEVKLRDRLHSDVSREAGFQPRPNVLFEGGMAMALFPNRTIIVEMGDNIRPISDLNGIHTVRFDYSSGMQKALANRLEIAGCIIDKSRI